MDKLQAIELLKTAPRGSKPSRVNPSLTQAQAVEFVEGWIAGKEDDYILPDLFEKRVYQVARNQRKPRY